MIAGVCGGIGEYFNIDPTLIRIIWAALVISGGTGLIAYIACALIIPSEEDEDEVAGKAESYEDDIDRYE